MTQVNKSEYREIVTLVSEQEIDQQKLLELRDFLRERNIECKLLELDSYCIEVCQKLIRVHGPSYVLSQTRLIEAILQKTSTSDTKGFDLLVDTLRRKLTDLAPSQSLMLIDSYIFTPQIPDKQGYLKMFEDIFGPIASNIKKIRFVTSPNHYDKLLYKDVAQLLRKLNPQLLVERSFTKDFHDIFWIADGTKGLFIGTSLNGIGKKYALVDNMIDDDTKMIIAELRKLGLL